MAKAKKQRGCKLEQQIQATFGVDFVQFIETNFKIGDTRYQIRDQIHVMSDAVAQKDPTKESIRTSASTVWNRINYYVKSKEMNNFRFDVKNKGRKSNQTEQEMKHMTVELKCKHCGKKHKNREISEIEVNLRPYQCPACKEFATCVATITKDGLTGIRAVVKVPLGNTDRTIKRTVWVDNKLNPNPTDNPFEKKKSVPSENSAELTETIEEQTIKM